MKSETEKFKTFKNICSENNIVTDLKSFYKFCNRASYFNWQEDKLFYEYAPLELRSRSNHSVKHLFEKFEKWNTGEKHFLCREVGGSCSPEVIVSETMNKAKYKYSRTNGIPYVDVRW
ncbi:hypothetical protein G1K75_12875 [Tenacibaculum finnmarkense]|uniref:hypothetical protein n=1 Tax=Tenacibaculum finnmarkense TaxID=2781243 RepID=UPI001EFB923D|nr:hypothetical protein [Tenacibaculum finnmarkense]MCG8806542.1 hypothetical protein [Tenacibaculum finnmarkense]MCG8857694.1 hypothetical protein [Tenacibaculum finnmarkense]